MKTIKEIRAEFSKKNDQETLAALGRTVFQELNLEDYLYLVGKSVRIAWNKKDSGLTAFSCPDSFEVVESVVKFGGGEIMAFLVGCAHPVRVERLTVE